MMSRRVAGIACRIRVPIRHYQAVAVLVRNSDHVIRLVHSEAELSVDVEAFDTLETAEEYRDRLASFLDLPPLTLAGQPSDASEDEFPTLPTRRRNPVLRGRRPRLLARRGTRGDLEIRKVEGHELIARN